jgi:hypothetical protein
LAPQTAPFLTTLPGTRFEAGLVTVERQGATMLYELNMTVLDDLLKTVFGWTTPTAPKGRSHK